MENKINILITGVGSPGGPGIIKAILEEKEIFNIYLCDADQNATGKYLIEKNFRVIPKASDPNFIDFLLKLCKEYNIKLIIPLVTRELLELSKKKYLFKENNIDILVSDYESLKILNDKGLLYNHLKNNKIKVPRFELINKKKDFTYALKRLGYPKLPVIMKPRISNGSRGVRIISEEFKKFELLFFQKPNSLFIKLEEVLSIIGDRNFPPLILSEFLPGEELTVDCILNNGNIENIIIRTRDQMREGISIKGKFIKNEKIIHYIQQILCTLKGLDGSVGFQLKKSTNEEYLLLESNPRLQGSSTTALGIGINIPVIIIKNKLGIKNEINEIKNKVAFSRFYENIFYEY